MSASEIRMRPLKRNLVSTPTRVNLENTEKGQASTEDSCAMPEDVEGWAAA